MDQLATLAITLGTVSAAVWALVELIGKHFPRLDRALLAIGLGPLFALAAHRYGFLPLPLAGTLGYGAAAFTGLIATLTSKLFHDYVSSPLSKRSNGG
jgi:hypothetical protein